MIHLFPSVSSRRGHRCGPRLDSAPERVLFKAAAAVAVTEGHISAQEACGLCGMDAQELEVWRHVVRDHGLRRMFCGRL